jgi:hypothetical protein
MANENDRLNPAELKIDQRREKAKQALAADILVVQPDGSTQPAPVGVSIFEVGGRKGQ